MSEAWASGAIAGSTARTRLIGGRKLGMGARRRMTPEVSVTPVVEAAEPMDPLTFEVQNLRRVLEPTSIAVIGASDQSFFSRTVFENLKRSGFEGSIVPVNPSRSS